VPGRARRLGHARWPERHHLTRVRVVTPHQDPLPAHLDEPGIAYRLQAHRSRLADKATVFARKLQGSARAGRHPG